MGGLKEYDLDFDEDDMMNLEEDEPDTVADQSDIDCFSNLIGSPNCTTRVYSDDISEQSIQMLKDFPGAEIQIVSLPDPKPINDRSCEILSIEDGHSYVLVFIKYDAAMTLNDKYSLDIDTSNVMSEGDIETEASKIIEGTDDESPNIS